MSSSTQAASSQANQQEVNELMSEIAFQKVLLSSIDDSVENRDEAEEEVRNEIKTLEKKLRALKRGTISSALQSTATSSSQIFKSTGPPSKSRKETIMHDFLGAGSGYQARGSFHKLATTSSTSSTPNSTNSFEELISPSRMELPSRKRSHTKHLDGSLAPQGDNKSRRTSPSPFTTDPTTPSTSSVDDEFDAFDSSFFQLQQEIEDRLKQEKADAELALSLQNGHAPPRPAFAPANVTAGITAFDRLSGMRPLPASSLGSTGSMQGGSTNSSTKQEWPSQFSAPNVKYEPSSLSAMGLSSDYTSSTNNMDSFKKWPSSSIAMPGAFVDDSSTASDSDIEFISPEAFHDNGRHDSSRRSHSTPYGQNAASSVYGATQPPIHRPSFSPEAQTAGEAALRRFGQGSTSPPTQMATYGNQNVPNRMNALPLPISSQTFGLPGSYPRPVFGMSSNISYAPSQGYGTYGSLPGSNGRYLGQAGGSMHIAGPGLGYTMNGSAGGALGNGYNNQPNPFQAPGGNYGPNPFSRPVGDIISNIFARPSHHQMGDQYDYIMNDPRKTNDEIKTLLENIRPDVELPLEDREGTPDGLVYPLYEHQKIALTWMKSMEEGTNKGGILADDMGLGKTISTLALMLSRPSTDRARKTTLIVGPVALVRQWDRELRMKVKASHRMSTHMIHGPGRKFAWDELRNYDVVMTTYGTLGAEFRRLEKWLNQQKEAGHERDYDQSPMTKLFPLLGPKSLFYRVILDEAQCIKNKTTLASRAAKELKALTRFCLTGTPMMNNVGELYSLIHFLRIKPYNVWQTFQDEFGCLTKGDATQTKVKSAMQKLQAVIKAILLRRTKTSLIDGKPIINLPPKTEEIQHVVFSEEEHEFYKALETKTQIQFNKYMRANTVGKNYSNVLVLLLRLRQACCHPHLITDFEEAPVAGGDLSVEAMIELAKTLGPDVVGRLTIAEGFECPVCYDGVENPSIMLPCGHDICVECLSKVSDNSIQQNQADGNEAGGALKCPTCRGQIDLKKIIDFATFKKVHMPDQVSQKDIVDVDESSETESGTDSDSTSETESEDDADGNGDLRDFIVPDDVEDTEDEEDNDGDDGDDGDDEAEAAPKRKSKSKKAKKDKHQKSKKGKKKEEKKHISLAVLKKEASTSIAGRRRYMKYLRKNWQSSAKVDKCVELLEQFQNDGKKTIIFSQFVSLLDLLQVPIDQQGWKCERYDGAMNAEARNNAIVRFTDKPDVKIMLISLKAGNAGLNLVAASRVIILDPFWNPFIEMQAVDRAYRIGQQNPVQVHRILIKSTVEDRIIELQENKRKLVESALDEVASKSIARLDVNQLAFLFGVGGAPR